MNAEAGRQQAKNDMIPLLTAGLTARTIAETGG
jgi:hypothetical protein